MKLVSNPDTLKVKESRVVSGLPDRRPCIAGEGGLLVSCFRL